MKFIKGCFKLLALGCLLIALVGIVFPYKQKIIDAQEVSEAVGVPYEVQPIGIGNKRPGIGRRIKYIVVHNTANKQSTAQNERDYLDNPTNTASTSWHIVVDDTKMIEAIPVGEMAFHAGDQEGNQYGIGIEICESGNYERAEANAQKLIAYLMAVYRIPVENVETHEHFSGKACPRLILDRWDGFLEKIEQIN